jgi:hypothetical protein
VCFALAPCPHTLSPHLVPTPCLFTLRPHTLSPHLVSLRFVAALCPYALSKAKAQATEAQKARPIVLVLVLGPRYYRYCRACRYCRRVSTGIDRYRQVATGSMTIAEWCSSVARTFLSARAGAGRQECLPHTATLHRCAQPGRHCPAGWRASAGTSPAPDPHRPQPTPIDPSQPQSTTIEACERRPRRLSKLPTATAYCSSPPPSCLPAFLIQKPAAAPAASPMKPRAALRANPRNP